MSTTAKFLEKNTFDGANLNWIDEVISLRITLTRNRGIVLSYLRTQVTVNPIIGI